MSPPYRIFVSYSKFDELIADTVASSINNYFRGDINVFFAPKNIQAGDKWKKVILNALREYDALILLISPDTYEKPWLIAEFTAFWLQDKDIYILKYGDLDFSKLFNIFTDYQICDIKEISHIKGLIEVLSTKAGTVFSPFDKVEEFSRKLGNAINDTFNNRIFSISIRSKTIEVQHKDIAKIAQKIPKNAKANELSKNEIKNLAQEIGLFSSWVKNPQLKYEDGDIGWYSQQDYTQLKIEADFHAKFLVLSLAEREGIKIETQGDL